VIEPMPMQPELTTRLDQPIHHQQFQHLRPGYAFPSRRQSPRPAYPLRLFQRVITVSLETMKIVKALPSLGDLADARRQEFTKGTR
jgi:hypothetical protein